MVRDALLLVDDKMFLSHILRKTALMPILDCNKRTGLINHTIYLAIASIHLQKQNKKKSLRLQVFKKSEHPNMKAKLLIIRLTRNIECLYLVGYCKIPERLAIIAYVKNS